MGTFAIIGLGFVVLVAVGAVIVGPDKIKATFYNLRDKAKKSGGE